MISCTETNRCTANKRRDKRLQGFIALYFLSVLLPTTGKLILVRPMLCLFMYLMDSLNLSYRLSVHRDMFFFFATWFLCVAFGQIVMVGEPHVSSLIHEFARIAMYFVIALPLGRIRLNRKELYIMSSILLTFNFIIQFLELIGVRWIFDFIKTYYHTGEDLRHLNLALNQTITSFRSGSIFINPNVYCPIALFCMAIQFFIIEKKILQRQPVTVLNYLILLIGSFSLLLTGSRTALLALGILMALFAAKVFHTKPLLIGVMGVIGIFVILRLVSMDARAIMISSGMDDSFGTKMREFTRYLREVNPISYIVGNNSNIGSLEWGFDFEWGYVFVYTGIVGTVNYLKLHKKLIARHCGENNPELYKYVLLALLCESMSATVLFNSYSYPLLALFVFSEGVYDEQP